VRLVLGLGNPGERYAATRHNVAWRVLDELARRWRLSEDASVPGLYDARRGQVGAETVEVMRPQTYMNLSGQALEAWIRREGERPPEELLVVTDDVYLPVGHLRLRARGSSGGHRGLESLEAVLGHRDFARLRVGVGAAESSAELKQHVLETFGSEEEPIVERVVRNAADAVECWASEGIERAMNRFNRRIDKEVPEP
jgi:PTH1 family peptidyl-tRNA hydrolase